MSGGAPLGRDVAEFFWGAGVPIYEGYGLTETSPVLTVNAHGAVKLGTVGKAIPGVELRIAEDGEILAKGPNIMRGYFNNPEATAEVIDARGLVPHRRHRRARRRGLPRASPTARKS